MEIFEQRVFALPREELWEALVDPAFLKPCMPGCEALERISATSFTMLIGTRVGPLRARFSGTIELTDLNPPESFTMLGRGRGGVTGFARGSAKIRLQERIVAGKKGTLLSCTVEASVEGRFARFGSRLVDIAARKMTSDFMSRFVDLMEQQQQ